MAHFYDLSARLADGSEHAMREWRGSVLLVVNTASRCGFTPQYEGLELLYRRFAPQGFSVLAFPCNQFGGQEPGSDASIVQFCATEYHTTFPIFAKTKVNGPEEHPIFRYLKHFRAGALGTRSIKWNFTKFLLNCEGDVIGRFAPRARPATIEPVIRSLFGPSRSVVTK